MPRGAPEASGRQAVSRPAVNSDTDFEVSKPLKGTAGWLDDRFGGARGVRTYLLRKVYPDHWSFLLGEIALYSFIILRLIGITLFALALIEGLFGYSLPDDQLSGAGLRIFEGVLQGIPIVGTYLAYFLFGGPFPGHDIVPRMYIIHVLLIPGILLALITAHIFIMFWQKHTQMPAKGITERNVVGQPSYPYFVAK